MMRMMTDAFVEICEYKGENVAVFRVSNSGRCMIVSAEDALKVRGAVTMSGKKRQYCQCSSGGKGGVMKSWRSVLIHRLVMGCPEGMDVDHINGNPYDNRRSNLRICSRRQNLWNRKKDFGNHAHSSIYKGVSWSEYNNAWCAQIWHDGMHRFMGYFDAEEDAARAYDKVAEELRGHWAVLNFPREEYAPTA